MFTLDQIAAVHARVRFGADFPAYIQALKALGVLRYDNAVADGSVTYHGRNGFRLQGPPRYHALPVARDGSPAALQQALTRHQQGDTDYPSFCRQAAEAGVWAWEVNAEKSTCTYLDRHGAVLLEEAIPEP